MLLANALYFKGLWRHPFNRSSTFVEPFFTADGRSTWIPMMHGFGTFQAGILDNLGAKAVFLPYQVLQIHNIPETRLWNQAAVFFMPFNSSN